MDIKTKEDVISSRINIMIDFMCKKFRPILGYDSYRLDFYPYSINDFNNSIQMKELDKIIIAKGGISYCEGSKNGWGYMVRTHDAFKRQEYRLLIKTSNIKRKGL